MADDFDREVGTLETDQVTVRNLQEDDLNTIVSIDEKITGRSRKEFYKIKMQEVLKETGIKISLIAELDQMPVGFLMGSVYYGEFGLPEPTAIIDTIGVHPDFKGQHIGQALMRQVMINLKALDIKKIQTQVDWNQFDLIHFFEKEGFEPAKKICLEVNL